MSQTIDQKVVEMRFDNTQFKKAVGETQQILKDFNSDLNFDTNTKKINKFGDAIDTVKVKFSALETIGITALARITDRAITAGERIVKSLSSDNIAAGWNKYADKTISVQTIMAATADDFSEWMDDAAKKYKDAGSEIEKNNIAQELANKTHSSLEDTIGYLEEYISVGSKAFDMTGAQMEYVNGQIERLNWFTDETSYNFNGMVETIGKLVAAGMELSKSVDAVQGIATWAALSGAGPEKANHVMGQLAQAVGAGTVRAIDWMSVENAGMASREVKELMIDTALKAGTLKVDNDGITFAPNTKKGTDVDYKTFRTTLSEGWLTSDVLVTALERYGKFATNLNTLSESLQAGFYETTSQTIKSLEAYDAGDEAKKFEILEEYSKKTGLSIEELREQFEALVSDELGMKAFKAAQEAVTFAQAVQSVKDAVSTGWMNSFEKMFGSYDKARKLWTALANDLWEIFNGGAENRNAILDAWVEGGGQEHVFDILTGLTGLVIDFKDAWNKAKADIFGEFDENKSASRLLSFTEKIRDFIKSLRLFNRDERGEIVGLTKKGEAVVGVLKTVLSVLKVIGKILTTTFKVAWRVVKSVWKALQILFDGIKAFIDGFKTFFGLGASKKQAEKKIAEIAGVGEKADKKLSIFEKIGNKLKEWSETFDKSAFLKSMRDWGFKAAAFLTKAWNFIKTIPGKVNSVFKQLFGIGIDDAIKKLWDRIKDFFKWLQDQQILVHVWDGIKSFFGWLWDGLKGLLNVESFQELVSKVNGVFVKIFDSIANLFRKKKMPNGEESLISSAASTTTAVKEGETVLEETESSLVGIMQSALVDKIKKVAQTVKKGGEETEESAVTIIDVFKSVTGLLESILDAVKRLFNAINFKAIFKIIGTIIESIFIGFAEAIKKMDGPTLTKMFLALIAFMHMLRSIFVAIAFMWIAGTPSDLAVAAKRMANAQQWRAISDAIKNLTILIGVVSAAIIIIGKVAKGSELAKGGLVVLSIIAVVTALVVILSKTVKGRSLGMYSDVIKGQIAFISIMTGISMFLIALSAMILVFAIAIKQIASVEDTGKMAAAAGLVIGLVAVVFGLAIAMIAVLSRTKTRSIKDKGYFDKSTSNAKGILSALSLFMLTLSRVMKTLTNSIVTLASIEDPKRMEVAALIVTSLTAMVFGLAIVMVAILSVFESSVTRNDKTINKVTTKGASVLLALSVFMIALGAAVHVLIAAIAVMATMINKVGSDTVNEAMWRVIGLVGLVAIVAVTLSILSAHSYGGPMMAASAVMLVLAVVIRSLAITVGVMASMMQMFGADLVDRAFIYIIATLVLVGALTGILEVLSSISSPTGILAVSAVLLALGIVVRVLTNAVAQVTELYDKYGDSAGYAFAMVIGLVVALGLIAALLLGLSSGPANAASVGKLAVLSLAIIAIAVALRVLIPVFELLSSFSLGQILATAGGIVAIMAAFAVGGSLMATAAPGLILFAGLLLTLAVAMSAAALLIDVGAKSMSTFADGIVYFAKTINKNQDVIVSSAVVIANAIVSAFERLLSGALGAIRNFLALLAGMSGEIFDNLTTIATNLIGFLTSLVEPIVGFFTELFIQIIKGITATVPDLKELLGSLLEALFDILIELIPKIVELAVELVTQLLEKLAENSYRIGTALVKLVKGLIDALADNIGDLVDSLVTLWENLFNALTTNVTRIVQPAMKFIGSLIGEIADSFDEEILAPISEAITGVIETVLGAPIAGIMGSVGIGLSEFAFQASDFFDAINQVDPDALNALGALGGFIAAITASSVVQGISKLLNPFEMLGDLAHSAGELFGVDIGHKSSILGDFAKELVAFADPLIEFSNKIKGQVDTASIEAVGIAGQIMASLQNNMPNVGGVIQKIFGEKKDLGTFGTELATFGEQFAIFYESIKDLDVKPELVQAVTYAGQIMASLYDHMPNVGGVIQKIFGETKDLGTFGTELATFGEQFSIFYDSIKDLEVKPELVETVTNCAKMMAGLYDHMPNVGGLMQKLFGETKDLGTFGEEMSQFADGFVGFATKISEIPEAGYNEDRIKSVGTIASTFSSMYEDLPNVGGVMDWLKGKRADLSMFGSDMAGFADGFKEFSSKISSNDYAYDEGKVESVTSIAERFSSLYETLSSGDLFEKALKWFQNVTKTDYLTGFGDAIGRFASSMTNAVNQISTNMWQNPGGMDDVSSYMAVVDDLLAFAERANDETYVVEGATKSIGTFIDALVSRALWNETNESKLKNAGIKYSGTFSEGIKAGFENLNTVANKIISGKSLNNFELVLWNSFGGDAIGAIATSVSNLLTTGTPASTLKSAGIKMANYVLNSMSDKFNAVVAGTDYGIQMVLYNLTNKIVDTFCNYFKSDANTKKVQDLALWLITGLVKGIDDLKAEAQAAGQNVADYINDRFKNTEMIKSPSRVWYQYGQYLVQGLSNGINENLYTAGESGENIGESALDGFQKAMLAANDYVSDSMDGPLTLTPVLDLSEIQNGTNQLSQMMSSVDGYSLDGSARFASDAYLSRHVNDSAFSGASVDRLTNAIEDLIQNPQASNFANTFNINGTNAHEIAEEVSRILQMQVERRRAVWG